MNIRQHQHQCEIWQEMEYLAERRYQIPPNLTDSIKNQRSSLWNEYIRPNHATIPIERTVSLFYCSYLLLIEKIDKNLIYTEFQIEENETPALAALLRFIHKLYCE